MLCPICNNNKEMLLTTKSMPFTYKNETITVAVTGNYCAQCGEMVLDNEEWKRVDGIIKQFHNTVNLRNSDPNFIRDVRKKLHLNQKEAGRIFGGGANAFSRYENGIAEPPVSLVKLIKILDRHPELLEELF